MSERVIRFGKMIIDLHEVEMLCEYYKFTGPIGDISQKDYTTIMMDWWAKGEHHDVMCRFDPETDQEKIEKFERECKHFINSWIRYKESLQDD